MSKDRLHRCIKLHSMSTGRSFCSCVVGRDGRRCFWPCNSETHIKASGLRPCVLKSANLNNIIPSIINNYTLSYVQMECNSNGFANQSEHPPTRSIKNLHENRSMLRFLKSAARLFLCRNLTFLLQNSSFQSIDLQICM